MALIDKKFDVDVHNYTDVRLEMFADYEGRPYKELVYRTGEVYAFLHILYKETGWKKVYMSDLLDSKEMQALMLLYSRAVNYLNKEQKGGTQWHAKMTSL